MAGIVVIFDFDKTILDVDSDNWVIDELGATDIFNQLLPTMPWNPLMDRMMLEIYSKGKTVENIAHVLKQVPIHPRVITAIKAAHSLGCDLRIVSDANTFFIETILEHFGLRNCFSEVNTNPSFIDQQGRLRIAPYHTCSPHGCILCPPNMCKGLIIKRIQESVNVEGNKRKKMVYFGDGVGDYCPSLLLKVGDYMMPKKNFPVWDLICKNPDLVKAEIREWSDGEELAQILLQHINKIIMEDENNTNPNCAANLFSLECKFQTSPTPMYEALPQPLPVRL